MGTLINEKTSYFQILDISLRMAHQSTAYIAPQISFSDCSFFLDQLSTLLTLH